MCEFQIWTSVAWSLGPANTAAWTRQAATSVTAWTGTCCSRTAAAGVSYSSSVRFPFAEVFMHVFSVSYKLKHSAVTRFMRPTCFSCAECFMSCLLVKTNIIILFVLFIFLCESYFDFFRCLYARRCPNLLPCQLSVWLWGDQRGSAMHLSIARVTPGSRQTHLRR